MIHNWKGKRVTVMGLGGFGGGVGVTRWLAARGARVLVTDLAPAQKLANSLDQIKDLDVALRLGGHEEHDFCQTELVVVNPAVPEESPFLQAARAAGVPVSTEINLFVERCAARCVGVTGSVGKSTVTAMIGHVLEKKIKGAGDQAATGSDRPRVWVGGNIGRSLLEALDDIRAHDVVVLELSSFQLQRTPAVQWSPHVAVITAVTPNHLDWHGSFSAYVAAKLNIVRFQDPQRDLIVVHDTGAAHAVLEQLRDARPAIWRYGLDGDLPVAVRQSTSVPTCDDEHLRWDELQLTVPGRHNRENAAAALAVAHVLGVSSSAATDALKTFEALPHRLQRVAVRAGVTYLDDSKATTPEAALTALRAIDGPVLVILGGYDKGSDLRPVAEETARRAKFAACIGATGGGLAETIRAVGGDATYYEDLPSAVAACRQRVRRGDTVLLSPACASWDQFVDYRVRGSMFAQLAQGEATAS